MTGLVHSFLIAYISPCSLAVAIPQHLNKETKEVKALSITLNNVFMLSDYNLGIIY